MSKMDERGPGMPGRGRFSHTYQGPPRKQGGLDWDQIRRDHHEQMIRQVEAGLQDEETKLWRDNDLASRSFSERDEFLARRALQRAGSPTPRASSLTPEDRAAGGRKRARRIDAPEVERLYVEENMKPGDIAVRTGFAYETVVSTLKLRGVFDPNKFRGGWKGPQGSRGPGPKQKTVCSRGHDLTAEGATKQLWKHTANGPVRNGRACVKCWGGASS